MRKWIVAIVFMLMMVMSPAQAQAEELYTAETTIYKPLFREGYIEDSEEILIYKLEGSSWAEACRTRVKQALDNNQTVVSLYDIKIPYSEANDVFDCVWELLDENPQYFYYSGHLSISGMGYSQDAMFVNTLTVSVASKYSPNGRDNIRWDLIEQDKVLYNAGFNDMLSSVKPGMTNLEKVLALHDAMVRECDYDYDNYLQNTIPDESYSALGVFAYDTAVCQGYAEAFVDLCNAIGVPCKIVSSGSMNHAWNLVYLDGYWYHMDATWDDPVGNVGVGFVSHDYFLYSDAEFQNDRGHYGWAATVPQATNSGAYAGYAFRDKIADMSYSEGVWYYQDWYDWYGNIYAAFIDGSGEVSIYQDSDNVETHGRDGILYIGKSDGIYTMKPSVSTQVALYKSVEDMGYGDLNLEEFTIRNNQLLIRLANASSTGYTEVKLPLVDSANYHVHTGTYVSAKEPTCITDGNRAYYKCSCGKYFADANCLSPIQEYADVVVSQTGHTEDASGLICTVCGADLPWFADVDTGAWQYPFALYACREGIMTGKGKDAYGNTKFYPKENLTRAEFAQVLYNMEGKPSVEYHNIFPDVIDGKWYCNAIFWAWENGLVTGYDSGNFGTEDKITREQMAIMFYKYAAYKDYDVNARTDVTVYSDYEMIHSWAYEEMSWANANGIINGNGSGLNPRGYATRGECAAMVYNFLQQFEQ